MANTGSGQFSRRAPDFVTEELAAVLNQKSAFEFKALFTLVYANLRARSAASGGEEMLRLRVYEKLQNLVSRGVVKKKIAGANKTYAGIAAPLGALIAEMKASRDAFANRAAAATTAS